MVARTGRFRRSDRLLRPRDFQRVLRRGGRTSSPEFVVLVARRESPARAHASLGSGPPRLGLTVSRKVGNAVVRNRIKRSVREWFRAHRRELGDGIDVVVIARRPASSLRTDTIGTRLCTMLGLARATPRPPRPMRDAARRPTGEE